MLPTASEPADRHITKRKPEWLRVQLPRDSRFSRLGSMLNGLGLSTVCRSARCPNICECFSTGTATFLILGDVCTRSCAFCNIASGSQPAPPMEDEPARVSKAVGQMGLTYAVITSVSRDDLPDGGAGHFARVISQLKQEIPGLTVETLIPDFQGREESLATVLTSGVDVLNHNLETVPELYPRVRPQAAYHRSLELLDRAKAWSISSANGQFSALRTKSGLILGLGETRNQLRRVMADLASVGCDILTMGQYLAPSARHHPVMRWLPPEEFSELAEIARKEGIPTVFSAPLVRSSYHAHEVASAEATR
ncbi:lipoic acid synthetase [Desulfonatronum thiosulfatophilum]|uniref:Lipoyl synthase n=1 Tax=Desulfonatronum thiosulfatophilum TaxID=617002 RepID=A0A1G6BX47_9BACT|nr:lipoyl synthase [Desulfonatronum thiosulfatophilum]SDB25117.1 lipoic acid synthetase [Desulfonatronum thiosulfatophilum]